MVVDKLNCGKFLWFVIDQVFLLEQWEKVMVFDFCEEGLGNIRLEIVEIIEEIKDDFLFLVGVLVKREEI